MTTKVGALLGWLGQRRSYDNKGGRVAGKSRAGVGYWRVAVGAAYRSGQGRAVGDGRVLGARPSGSPAPPPSCRCGTTCSSRGLCRVDHQSPPPRCGTTCSSRGLCRAAAAAPFRSKRSPACAASLNTGESQYWGNRTCSSTVLPLTCTAIT